MKTDWSTYILQCADGSFYCGVTNNLENRLARHNEGSASKYTRSRLPVTVAAVRSNLTKSHAFRLEHYIKKLPARKKIEALASGPEVLSVKNNTPL